MKISRLLNSYKKLDPNKRIQQALPTMIFEYMNSNRLSIKNLHISLLATGALFFGMRSCEYLKVNNQSKKLTKLLRIKNFRFFIKNIELDIRSNQISSASYVAVTFESQKNGDKNCTIIQHRSKKSICPVKSWGKLIRLILSYPNTNIETEICYFYDNNLSGMIRSHDLILHLRATAQAINYKNLGIDIKRIGTHSIRTSFAMLLYLEKTDHSVIMTLGRWISLAFLNCIRPQIQEFSKEISSIMTSGSRKHFNVLPVKRNNTFTNLQNSSF